MVKAMPSTNTASVRDRLLAAAEELFYAEGIHAVGIDRVLAHAGVAKASLYATFGSKEDLVAAYVEKRAATREKRILDRIAPFEEPRERILAIFDAQLETVAHPRFRGCAFVNTWTEVSDSKAGKAALAARAWLRALFHELAQEMGVEDPERLARRLHLLYDAGAISGSFREQPVGVEDTRAMAEMLLDAAEPPRKKRR